MWVARTETGSTVEEGVMGVGEGSVCASVQNMGLCVGGDEGGVCVCVCVGGVRLTSRVGLFGERLVRS